MTREYGRVVGVTVVLIGIVGLLLGQKSLFGALNIRSNARRRRS